MFVKQCSSALLNYWANPKSTLGNQYTYAMKKWGQIGQYRTLYCQGEVRNVLQIRNILDWANPSRGRKSRHCHRHIPRAVWWHFFLHCPVFLFTDHLVDGGSSLQKLLVWVFPWQLEKGSLSLWDLCFWTWMMRGYALARERCFWFSLANFSTCVYLIFLSHCAASIGRERKCLTSVFYNFIISQKKKNINITTVFSENSFSQPHLRMSECFEWYRFICLYIIKHIYFSMLFNFISNV